MQLFESLALGFFRVFGITEPTATTRRRAAWFLLALLSVALVILCIVASVAVRVIH
jgi:hypothetical protein